MIHDARWRHSTPRVVTPRFPGEWYNLYDPLCPFIGINPNPRNPPSHTKAWEYETILLAKSTLTPFSRNNETISYLFSQHIWRHKRHRLYRYLWGSQDGFEWLRDTRFFKGLQGTFYTNLLLIHWSPYKVATMLQTTFSNVFSWTKPFEFQIKVRWNMFFRV